MGNLQYPENFSRRMIIMIFSSSSFRVIFMFATPPACFFFIGLQAPIASKFTVYYGFGLVLGFFGFGWCFFFTVFCFLCYP